MPASPWSPEGPEVETRSGWLSLGGHVPPTVDESGVLRVRGVEPGAVVDVGPVRTEASRDGFVQVRLLEHASLRGHLGLVELFVDGRIRGEVEILPDKVSQAAYDRLRGDLERTWTGLVLDPAGASAVRATLPPARELWRRIERPVHAILSSPRDVVVGGVALRRLDRVHRAVEITPALVRRGLRGRPAAVRSAVRSTDTAEQAMVARTLRMLATHARRGGEVDVEHRLTRLLRDPVLRSCTARTPGITWGMRSDARYRQVLDVFRVLDRPALAATEGPGDLRLGVRGMVRLYEYWVFLQVLSAARDLYGPPVGTGFDDLAVRTRSGTRRLEIAPGTTVTFPGSVHVAFEPWVTARGDGWMDLELVPHPDHERAKLVATPDVAVLRTGPQPWLTVIDAKYVARTWVERAAADIHEKYARIRRGGAPVVRHVVAVHPHAGLSNLWAGYGHVAMAPGSAPPPLPLPRPGARSGVAPAAGPAVGGGTTTPSHAGQERRSGPVVVVADQWWMHRHLGGRRIDLRDLRSRAASGRPVRSAHIVLPDIPPLAGFAAAAEARGWEVHRTPPGERASNVDAVVELAARVARDERLVVVSGDPHLLGRLGRAAVEMDVVDDLTTLPPFTRVRADRRP